MASVYKERGKWTCSWYDHDGKRQYARGLPTKGIAEQIGQKNEFTKVATLSVIRNISRNRSWAHVPWPDGAEMSPRHARALLRKAGAA